MAHFPISANGPYDRFGNSYNVSLILQTDDRFNETAYAAYSPLYLPATYAMTYLLGFALMTCILVHTVLYHGEALLKGIKKIQIEPDDIHAKLMRNYPEVPDWWYLMVFVTCFSMAIAVIEVSSYLLRLRVRLIYAKVWHTSVPVYILLLAAIIPALYMLPNGFIFALTGQAVRIHYLYELPELIVIHSSG
jgi:OPT oligopeptide transporter protein